VSLQLPLYCIGDLNLVNNKITINITFNNVVFAAVFIFIISVPDEPAEEQEVESDGEHDADGDNVFHFLKTHDPERGNDLQ
jgi:hypothetical protein